MDGLRPLGRGSKWNAVAVWPEPEGCEKPMAGGMRIDGISSHPVSGKTVGPEGEELNSRRA
jgi:hypothetical protein